MRYSKSILRQEEQLIQQSEQSKGIAEDLNTLTSAPKGRLAGLPEDFDPGMYLALNRDVATAGLDPSQHYLTTGAHEGRPTQQLTLKMVCSRFIIATSRRTRILPALMRAD